MDNREKSKDLLEAHNISQAKSAELLCIQTQRPCLDWAITALEKALKEVSV